VVERVLLVVLLSSGVAGAAERPWLKSPEARAQADEAAARARADDLASSEGAGRPPAPAPAPPRTRDGFFARLSLGAGYFAAASGASQDRRIFSGAPISMEADLGGTPAPWLGLGGAYTRDAILGISSDDEVIDGDEPKLDDLSFQLETLSFFASLYSDPASPFYGFASFGYGVIHVRSSDDGPELPLFSLFGDGDGVDPTGYAFTLGGGYDWWLSDTWTIGVSGRLLGARLSTDDGGVPTHVNVFIPSVALSFGYH
jgi:hypothetical protein